MGLWTLSVLFFTLFYASNIRYNLLVQPYEEKVDSLEV